MKQFRLQREGRKTEGCGRPGRRIKDCRGAGAPDPSAGYLLMEAMVYIGLVFLLVGVGTVVLFRSIDNSVALRRNADEISRAVHAGERWRADIRLATHGVYLEKGDEAILRLKGNKTEVDYRFEQASVFRRIGEGPWSPALVSVRSSSMEPETRAGGVRVWRWELELQPKAHGSFKPGKIRPLFTFLAVEPRPSKP